jgi:transcriptional regulator with XRE-family HTH domain
MPLLTGNQLRAARALVGVDQQYVAEAAGINVNTVRNMEARGFQPITSGALTVKKVQACLEALGVDFLGDKDPGVLLRTIWGSPATSRDGTEWGVSIYRDETCLFVTSIARAREMAENAARRGDPRTADELRKAADKAEHDAKEAPEFFKSIQVDRDAKKKRK